ncbi:MAG: diaminopimelate epimerase [Bacillus sp. (in: firmicutes)]
MKLSFVKCHGSGNDFLILDEYSRPLSLTDEERAQLTLTLCNRETGIGADGILFFQSSQIADGKMRVFNSDGSEASMCGNGLRCVARYGCELLEKKQLSIETMKAVLAVEQTEHIFEQIPTFKVEISPVSFEVKDLPMNVEGETFINQKLEALAPGLTFTAVAVPNPHFISIVDREVLESDVQDTLSTYVNGDNPYFPDGVNVSFVKLLEPGRIFVKTFERGVGFTNACGTAMSASTLVTCLQGENQLEQTVSVYNPGGQVNCVAHKKGDTYSIDLIGNATYEFTIDVEVQSDLKSYTVQNRKDFVEETAAYRAMQQASEQYIRTNM